MEQYMLGRRICATLAEGLAKTQAPGTDHIWHVSASTAEALVNQASVTISVYLSDSVFRRPFFSMLR